MPAMSSPKTAKPGWLRLETTGACAALLFCCVFMAQADEYFEGFDKAGKPAGTKTLVWDYLAELSPVAGWKDLVPGDGFAHLSAEREFLKDRPAGFTAWPFQALSVGPVHSNQRISIRAKNTAIPGVACMVFTYREKNKVDEIDIEIVADDTEGPRTGHRTGTGGGWTDIRLNTWANARGDELHPARSIRMPVIGADGRRVSHRDGKFHTYTIEWKPEAVRFYIDDVLQRTIDDIVPDAPSRVIFGMRQMPWAGKPDWSGTQTMLVDWICIESLKGGQL